MSTQIAIFSPIKLEPYVNPRAARTLAYQVVASLVIARGTLMGVVTATGKIKAYASGNVDGSQVPIGPSVYDFTTDASGNVTLGITGAAVDVLRPIQLTAEVYYRGTFLETDLVGFDANAVTAVAGSREIGIGIYKAWEIP